MVAAILDEPRLAIDPRVLLESAILEEDESVAHGGMEAEGRVGRVGRVSEQAGMPASRVLLEHVAQLAGVAGC